MENIKVNAKVQLARQVDDDPLLLDKMMRDLDMADDIYKPTNYWKYYEKAFMPELKKRGLFDYRRRKFSILASFGAVDLLLSVKVASRIKYKGCNRLANLVEQLLLSNPFFNINKFNLCSRESLTPYFYWYVKNKFDLANLNIGKCPTSSFGNPEDLVEIDNGLWSLAHLNYCSMVADASSYINFHDDMTVCELGAGMGRNIEILAHLFDRATFLLFDIPPQLYVSNQYLSAVFKERVISYRDAVTLKPVNTADFRSLISGRIIMLPSWKMPEWRNVMIDIFWNCASFQEMEPDVVVNYLDIVKSMSPRYVYINAIPQGNYWGKWKLGRGGTKEPVLCHYYQDSLKEKYEPITKYHTDYFLQKPEYVSYLFKALL